MVPSAISDSLGVYVSIPFCKAKCSFCNFASDVFGAQRLDHYLDRVLTEMTDTASWVQKLGATLPPRVDTIYLGGGTPSLLEPAQIERLFARLRDVFQVDAAAEITVEAAPGQLGPRSLKAFAEQGVNRFSFGVQSFIDAECVAVGRLHTGAECMAELERMSSAGFARTAIDLIVGLPGQTAATWDRSLDFAIASGVEHVSLYMLEVDEDSRLGREALSGGQRYGAPSLPADDAVADWYSTGRERLADAGVEQYEISNFARPNGQSRHNRKYWERGPYLGFGLDAHSMLRTQDGAVRWANADTMDEYLQGLASLGGSSDWDRRVDRIDQMASLEEALFLGLRLVEGVSLTHLGSEFGIIALRPVEEALVDLIDARLLARSADRLQLTARGRLVSNEVFSRLLLQSAA